MKQLTVVVALACLPAFLGAQPSATGNFRFITSDIDAFWKVFDEFKKDTTSNPFASYMTNGSAGLREYPQDHHHADTLSFKKTVLKSMDYYERVRSSSYRMPEYQDKIKTYYSEFKKIYPPATSPDIYFVMGERRTGSACIPSGILIGMEQFSDDEEVVRTNYGTLAMERLPVIVAATLVFCNAKPAHTGFTLLRQSIVLGSADFLASLITADDQRLILDKEAYRYGEQHEELLVKEFLAAKDSDDFSKWLFHPPTEGRPADLGYWIGYKITQAYYMSMPDKAKAIDDILKINDFEKFLVMSGYAEPFRH
jgi:hypothetical protein